MGYDLLCKIPPCKLGVLRGLRFVLFVTRHLVPKGLSELICAICGKKIRSKSNFIHLPTAGVCLNAWSQRTRRNAHKDHHVGFDLLCKISPCKLCVLCGLHFVFFVTKHSVPKGLITRRTNIRCPNARHTMLASISAPCVGPAA